MKAVPPFDEEEISRLVEKFYARVREDDSLGPVFNNAIHNWSAHLALLKEFWSTVLRGTGRYKGNPMLAHFRLPIEERHFVRWLQLFSETANKEMSARHAEVVVRKAEQIGMNMRRVLAVRPEASGPLEGEKSSADSTGSVVATLMAETTH